MISEIVLFSLPQGLSREEAMAKYRARIPVWRAILTAGGLTPSRSGQNLCALPMQRADATEIGTDLEQWRS